MSQQDTRERYEASFYALCDCVFAGVSEESIAQLVSVCKIDDQDRIALVRLMQLREKEAA